jgi:hypothetical protein
MNGQPTAILMAVESTRRNMHEPPREPRPRRRPRRATARALQAIAVRLDPAVVQKPQLS